MLTLHQRLGRSLKQLTIQARCSSSISSGSGTGRSRSKLWYDRPRDERLNEHPLSRPPRLNYDGTVSLDFSLQEIGKRSAKKRPNETEKIEPFEVIPMRPLDIDDIKRRNRRVIEASAEERKQILKLEQAHHAQSNRWSTLIEMSKEVGFVVLLMGLIYFAKIGIMEIKDWGEFLRVFKEEKGWSALYAALDAGAYYRDPEKSLLGEQYAAVGLQRGDKNWAEWDPELPFYGPAKIAYKRSQDYVSSDAPVSPSTKVLLDKAKLKLAAINEARKSAGLEAYEHLPLKDAYAIEAEYRSGQGLSPQKPFREWLPTYTIVLGDPLLNTINDDIFKFAHKVDKMLARRFCQAKVVVWDINVHRDKTFRDKWRSKWLCFMGSESCRKNPGYLNANTVLPFRQLTTYQPAIEDLGTPLDKVLVIDFKGRFLEKFPENTIAAPANLELLNLSTANADSSNEQVYNDFLEYLESVITQKELETTSGEEKIECYAPLDFQKSVAEITNPSDSNWLHQLVLEKKLALEKLQQEETPGVENEQSQRKIGWIAWLLGRK